MRRGLLAGVLLLVAAPGLAQQRVLQLTLTESQWAELLALGVPLTVVPAPPERSLAIPTALYLSAIAAEWTTAAPRCAIQCNSWTRTLPGVEDATIAAPVGLSINAGVLLTVHYLIAPRWPRVADAVLFSLTAFHAASATEHAASTRQTLKSSQP
jgi:hypothetical protein